MVEFLLNAPTTIIQGVASQVHDVEGIHDCPCIGEFFGSSTLKPGESIHRNDLNALTPRIGLGRASQVLKTCLERPGTMSKITVTHLS